MFNEKFLTIQKKWAVNEKIAVDNNTAHINKNETNYKYQDKELFEKKTENKINENSGMNCAINNSVKNRNIPQNFDGYDKKYNSGTDNNNDRISGKSAQSSVINELSELRNKSEMNKANDFSLPKIENEDSLNYQNYNMPNNQYNEQNLSSQNNELFKVKKIYHNQQKNYFKLSLYLVLPVFVGIFFALFLNKNDATESIWNEAVEFHNQKKYIKAIEMYLKYYEKSEFSEDKIKGLYYTAVCNLALKDYTTASQFFKKTLDINLYKNNFSSSELSEDIIYFGLSHYWLGKIMMDQKMYIEAIEEFNNVIVKYPDNPIYTNAYKNILFANIELKKWEKVIELSKILLTLRDANLDGSVYYYMALAYENMNILDLAGKYYRILIDGNNFDPKYSGYARKKIYNYLTIPELEIGNE